MTSLLRGEQPSVGEELRRNNLALLVRLLHLQGPLSRSQLAALTGLNRSTVGSLVGSLSLAGLARESSPISRSGAGRPSLVVALDPERAWVLAVELSTDAVAVARVGLGGAVIDRLAERHDWSGRLGPASAVATIVGLLNKLAARAPAKAQLLGGAVAMPGIVRRQDGFVHLAPNLGWGSVPFGSLLTGALPAGLPVDIANEADLGALAECARGAAVGYDNVIYISGNIGVGAGVLVGGDLLNGRSGYAGEVGHMKVNPKGHRCRCGGTGCWETEIGAAALLRRAGSKATDIRAAIERVLARARQGDAKASAAVHETAVWIGRGAADLVNIFNPEMLVFGGTLREVFMAAEPVVRQELRAQAIAPAASDLTIVSAGLKDSSVIVGAAELAFSPFLADPMGVLSGWS